MRSTCLSTQKPPGQQQSVDTTDVGRKYVRATVVDHIIPHRGDQKLFWDQNNWQALCKSCHDKKTLTEDINPTYTY